MKGIVIIILFFTPLAYAGEYVLISQPDSQELVEQCSRDAPVIEGTWSPTKAEIEELEADLHKLKEIDATGCCGSGKLDGDPTDYYRQYAGIIVKGKKYIYINSVPDEWHGSKHKPQVVCDGGKYFWGAVYDPDTKKFSNLAFNGEA